MIRIAFPMPHTLCPITPEPFSLLALSRHANCVA